jgi:hypothetical protein
VDTVTAMDTSEPSPGTSKEQSDGNPDNEPDFTIATSLETGLIVTGRSGSEAILGRKIPWINKTPSQEMPPEGKFPSTEMTTGIGSNSVNGLKLLKV